MKTVIIHGASDDLVWIAGCKGENEFNVNPHRNGYAGTFNLGGKMRIHAIYDGCWSFAVGQVDEDIPLPDWPIRVKQGIENRYTTAIEIDVPDDVKVFHEVKA